MVNEAGKDILEASRDGGTTEQIARRLVSDQESLVSMVQNLIRPFLLEMIQCRFLQAAKPQNTKEDRPVSESVPIQLTDLYLHVTDGCNLHYIYCYNASQRSQVSKYARGKWSSYLTTPQIRHLLDEAAKLEVKDVVFTGGEPICRRDVCELAAYAKERGLSTTLLTNGTLVDWRSFSQRTRRWRSRGVNISRGYRFRFLYEPGSTLMQELFTDFSGGCPAGLFESLIFSDGSVYPCDYLWEEKFCAGTLFQDGGIRRITTSPIFSMLHQLPPDKACIDCSYLRVCKGGCPGIRYMLEGQLAYPNPECPLLEARN